MTVKIFGIRNKATGEFISYGAKCAWKTSKDAKLAYWNHIPRIDYNQQRFDDQDEYEIVDLLEIVAMYEGLCK